MVKLVFTVKYPFISGIIFNFFYKMCKSFGFCDSKVHAGSGRGPAGRESWEKREKREGGGGSDSRVLFSERQCECEFS